MKNPNRMSEKMSLRVFKESLRSDGFLTINEVVNRLRAANFFDEESNEEAIFAYQKAVARKIMRREKDSRGRPIYANIEIINDEGETTNGYMQQSLFDVSHYKQVINYHNERAKHHIAESHEYAKDLKTRFAVQIELPFPLPDEVNLKAA